MTVWFYISISIHQVIHWPLQLFPHLTQLKTGNYVTGWTNHITQHAVMRVNSMEWDQCFTWECRYEVKLRKTDTKSVQNQDHVNSTLRYGKNSESSAGLLDANTLISGVLHFKDTVLFLRSCSRRFCSISLIMHACGVRFGRFNLASELSYKRQWTPLDSFHTWSVEPWTMSHHGLLEMSPRPPFSNRPRICSLNRSWAHFTAFEPHQVYRIVRANGTMVCKSDHWCH